MKITVAPVSTPEASQISVPLGGKIKDRFTDLCKAIHAEIPKDAKCVITIGEEAAALFRAMDWRGMQVPDGVELDGAKGFFMKNPGHVICKTELPEFEEKVVISPVSGNGLFSFGDSTFSLTAEE